MFPQEAMRKPRFSDELSKKVGITVPGWLLAKAHRKMDELKLTNFSRYIQFLMEQDTDARAKRSDSQRQIEHLFDDVESLEGRMELMEKELRQLRIQINGPEREPLTDINGCDV